MGMIVGLLARLLTSRQPPYFPHTFLIFFNIYIIIIFRVNRRESSLKVTAAIAASA
jgi:hypothetical protein